MVKYIQRQELTEDELAELKRLPTNKNDYMSN